MNIHELFEQHFARMHDVNQETVKMHRMSNGSYSLPGIARDFRCFKAGFEANQSGEMQVLGYLSEIGALRASQGSVVHFKKAPGLEVVVPVYVKQCDSHKKRSEA